MAWHSGKPAESDFLSASVQHIRENFAELEPLHPHVAELVDLTALHPHIAALLGSCIVEMGSNANGEYVRWENGLQICFVRGVAFTGDGTSDEKAGSWTHPAAFASFPVIVGRNADNTAPPAWHIEVNPGTATGVTNVSWRAYRVSGSWVSGLNYPLHYIAIGRW